MCGRFAFYSPAEATAALFGVNDAKPVEARYNIAPTQQVLAVCDDRGDRRSKLLRWGLVPSWSKDPGMGSRMINARSETAAEKPSFRSAFRHRRCLILADGYYEWKKTGTRKQPFYIRMQDERPFAMAGLWESWQGDGERRLDTCTILTTAANDLTSRKSPWRNERMTTLR